MLLIVLSLIAIAAAGTSQRPPEAGRPVAGSSLCQAPNGYRKKFLEKQGQQNIYFEDSPDIWGYTTVTPPFDEASEIPFYFAVVDYICGASRESCNATVTSLEQKCTGPDTVEIKAVIDVSNANTFISELTWKDYIAAGYSFSSLKVIYGCRLNQTSPKEDRQPSTSTPQACKDDLEWKSWLASSSGRFTFTYRLTGKQCTCGSETAFENSNYDYDLASIYVAADVNPTQIDNDVNWSGSGSFNSGACPDSQRPCPWAGVPGHHHVSQVFAGQLGPCGPTCFTAARGVMNVRINPVGDVLELRQQLIKTKPSLATKKPRAMLKQQALKK